MPVSRIVCCRMWWVLAFMLAGHLVCADPVDFYGRPVNVLKLFGQRHWRESSTGAPTASSLYHPAGIAIDQYGHCYIADSGNSRILGFRSIDRECADLVFEQTDFLSATTNGDVNLGYLGPASRSTLCLMSFPTGTNTAEQGMFLNIDVDADGNLYVPDIYNNRILMYRAPFSEEKTGGKAIRWPMRCGANRIFAPMWAIMGWA